MTISDPVTVETSLEALRRITPVPGAPERVWWTYAPIVANASGFPPGPTDYRLFALVEYRDAAEVEALLAGAGGEERVLPVPDWLPPDLAAAAGDGGLPVTTYRGAESFWNGVPSRPRGAGRFLIIEMTTS